MTVEQLAPEVGVAASETSYSEPASDSPTPATCHPAMPPIEEIRDHLSTLESELNVKVAARRVELIHEIASAVQQSKDWLTAKRKRLRDDANLDIKELRKAHRNASKKWTILAESLEAESPVLSTASDEIPADEAPATAPA
jgi:hypothetical protein